MKKKILFGAVVFLAVVSAVSVAMLAAGLGDVNGKDGVTSADAMLILKYEAGIGSPISDSVGDVNGDGSVNSRDAMLILQREAGLINKFPRDSGTPTTPVVSTIPATMGDTGNLASQYSYTNATYESDSDVIKIDRNTGAWEAYRSGTARVTIKDSSGNVLRYVDFRVSSAVIDVYLRQGQSYDLVDDLFPDVSGYVESGYGSYLSSLSMFITSVSCSSPYVSVTKRGSGLSKSYTVTTAANSAGKNASMSVNFDIIIYGSLTIDFAIHITE